MNKADINYRTITLKLDNSLQLQELSKECGRVYSKAVSYIHKIHGRKGFWLDAMQIQKIIKSDKLHSQTTQAVIQKYFASLKAYFQCVKTNPDAKPPHKTHKYYCIPFKQSAIKVNSNSIWLSCGKDRTPVIVSIPTGKTLDNVQYAEIIWNDGYYLKITTKVIAPEPRKEGKIVAVDPGEIHPLATWDGKKGTIYNGRLLRSEKQYREKVKASYTSKIDLKKTRSNRKRKLIKKKREKLAYLDRRIRDIEHKITRHFVETCNKDNVSTVVYGDTTNIRQDTDWGNKANQKLHQWNFNRIRTQIQYKCAEYGINFVLQDERGTSHTCPRCGAHVNPNGRIFRCRVCGFEAHRDIAGAMNIFSKYQGHVPVVASMAHATGVRFNSHLCCSDSKPENPIAFKHGSVKYQSLSVVWRTLAQSNAQRSYSLF
jgi:putative transposase